VNDAIQRIGQTADLEFLEVNATTQQTTPTNVGANDV